MSYHQKKRIPDGWKPGSPPSIGWWPASTIFDEKSLRWWDGTNWSVAISKDCNSLKDIEFWAGVRMYWKDPKVYWRVRPDDWPERSKT